MKTERKAEKGSKEREPKTEKKKISGRMITRGKGRPEDSLRKLANSKGYMARYKRASNGKIWIDPVQNDFSRSKHIVSSNSRPNRSRGKKSSLRKKSNKRKRRKKSSSKRKKRRKRTSKKVKKPKIVMTRDFGHQVTFSHEKTPPAKIYNINVSSNHSPRIFETSEVTPSPGRIKRKRIFGEESEYTESEEFETEEEQDSLSSPSNYGRRDRHVNSRSRSWSPDARKKLDYNWPDEKIKKGSVEEKNFNLKNQNQEPIFKIRQPTPENSDGELENSNNEKDPKNFYNSDRKTIFQNNSYLLKKFNNKKYQLANSDFPRNIYSTPANSDLINRHRKAKSALSNSPLDLFKRKECLEDETPISGFRSRKFGSSPWRQSYIEEKRRASNSKKDPNKKFECLAEYDNITKHLKIFNLKHAYHPKRWTKKKLLKETNEILDERALIQKKLRRKFKNMDSLTPEFHSFENFLTYFYSKKFNKNVQMYEKTILSLLYALETHRSDEIYWNVLAKLFKGMYTKRALFFLLLTREHILSYMKKLVGSGTSMELLDNKSFTISQCITMLKNVMMMYSGEHLEIFFIEEFFKIFMGKDSILIYDFIGGMVEIFLRLRKSGIDFEILDVNFTQKRKRDKSGLGYYPYGNIFGSHSVNCFLDIGEEVGLLPKRKNELKDDISWFKWSDYRNLKSSKSKKGIKGRINIIEHFSGNKARNLSRRRKSDYGPKFVQKTGQGYSKPLRSVRALNFDQFQDFQNSKERNNYLANLNKISETLDNNTLRMESSYIPSSTQKIHQKKHQKLKLK